MQFYKIWDIDNFFMNRFFLALLGIGMLISGCSPRPVPERIDRIGNVAMGEKQTPRNGEGELFEVAAVSLPEGFERMFLGVVPFDHQVYRMVLENDAVKTDGDVLEYAANALAKHFNIKFVRLDDNRLVSDLPGTRVEVRRAFHLGAAAVAVEFIDRKLSGIAAASEKEERFLTYKKKYALRNELILLAQAIADFKLDTGKVPEKLDDLTGAPWNVAGWNGPYCQTLPEIPVTYRKLAGENYDLYVEFDGKRIREDSDL